jgi:hypothetical protein
MKDIAGYEGKYAIDRNGVVWSHPNHTHKEMMALKPKLTNSGYETVCLCVNGVLKYVSVHRLVAFAYIGDVSGKDVNHINGNKRDNSIENLEISNRSHNTLHGIFVLKNGRAKLTHEQSEDVKSMVSSGKRQTEVAKLFGVSKQTINQIVRGVTYMKSSIALDYSGAKP